MAGLLPLARGPHAPALVDPAGKSHAAEPALGHLARRLAGEDVALSAAHDDRRELAGQRPDAPVADPRHLLLLGDGAEQRARRERAVAPQRGDDLSLEAA